VPDRILSVGHVQPHRFEQLARGPPELDADDRVVAPVRDGDRKPGAAREVELEPFDLGDEAAHGENRGGAGPPCAEPERVGHHRSLGEAAEDRAFRRHLELCECRLEPLGHPCEGGEERFGIGVADLADDVPVRSAGRKRERAAREEADQPAVGVEKVEKRCEVVLVGAATVEEN
jgi:hypothetical protein